MCNELKVGQTRKALAIVMSVLAPAPYEVMYVGNYNSFLRNTETGTETVVSNVWLRENTRIFGKYDDFKIDDPVLADMGFGSCWDKFHFAGVTSGGVPKVWPAGRTSYTAGGQNNYVTAVEVRRV